MLTVLLGSLLGFSSVTKANECQQTNKTCVQVIVNSADAEPLADMVVYLEPLEGQTLSQSSKQVEIGQYQKSFSPYISVSQSNSPVSFVNQDDITHHIYSAGNKNKFAFKIRAGVTNSSIPFNHPAEIAMGCNIHDWMSGYLLVVDTPYFGKTNAQGLITFSLDQSGKYRIVVWHPQMQTATNSMFVDKNIIDASTITLILNESLAKIPKQQSDDDFDFLSDY